MYIVTKNDWLMHHGIPGQKWGIRRFQNEDGSLTDEGRKRYNDYVQEAISKAGDAYYKREEEKQMLYGDDWDKYDSDPDNYNNRMKVKKYKDLANFIDKETKPYLDEVQSLGEQIKYAHGRELERLRKAQFEANKRYWDEYFSISEQYITDFFGKTEKERNKGRDFVYDHSGMWW